MRGVGSAASDFEPCSLGLSYARSSSGGCRVACGDGPRPEPGPAVPGGFRGRQERRDKGHENTRAAHEVHDVGGVHDQQSGSRAFCCRFRNSSASRSPDLRQLGLGFGHDPHHPGCDGRDCFRVGFDDALRFGPPQQHNSRVSAGRYSSTVRRSAFVIWPAARGVVLLIGIRFLRKWVPGPAGVYGTGRAAYLG